MYGTLIDRCKNAIEAARTVEYSVRDKSTGRIYKYGDNAYMDTCIENCVFIDRNPDIVKNPDDYFGFNRSNWELITARISEDGYIEELRKKLKTYEDAERQGLLLRLPCKVGDSVFHIVKECCFPGDCHVTRTCETCDYRDIYIEKTTVSSNAEAASLIDCFGKTVFLTREKAEQALEGGSENADQKT